MSQHDPSEPAPRRRNAKVAAICAVVFAGMVGAAYASVPLYRAFCQATGFGGTTQRASATSRVVLDRPLAVRFDTNVRDLPWTFTAEQTSQTVKLGETGMAFFKVTNTSDKAITGRAVYNVVPEQAGAYFRKLECFCFSDQTIGAHQTIEFPMIYFVDPEFATDFETKKASEVTLSYTFYPAVDAAGVAPAAAKGPTALGGSQSAGL